MKTCWSSVSSGRHWCCVVRCLLGLPPLLHHQSGAGQTAGQEDRVRAQRCRRGSLPRLLHQRTHQLPQEELCLSQSTLPQNKPIIITHLLSRGGLFTPTLSSKGPVNVCVLIMSVVTDCNKLHFLLVCRNEGESFFIQNRDGPLPLFPEGNMLNISFEGRSNHVYFK